MVLHYFLSLGVFEEPKLMCHNQQRKISSYHINFEIQIIKGREITIETNEIMAKWSKVVLSAFEFKYMAAEFESRSFIPNIDFEVIFSKGEIFCQVCFFKPKIFD